VKATIIPRKGFLGYAHPVPREELHIETKNMMLAEIKTDLASYVAEKLKFGTTGSGVRADFAMAYKLAHDMVYRYGMGDSGFLGNFYTHGVYSPRDGMWNVSEATKAKLDDDVQKILNNADRGSGSLTKERGLLDFLRRNLSIRASSNMMKYRVF
jgi:ATP-dependent Zn protease